MDPRSLKQQAAHDLGEACDEHDCKACCDHEFDWDEGYTCLNCGEQGDVGAAIDAAMDYGQER